jgi:hypothetical protein
MDAGVVAGGDLVAFSQTADHHIVAIGEFESREAEFTENF